MSPNHTKTNGSVLPPPSLVDAVDQLDVPPTVSENTVKQQQQGMKRDEDFDEFKCQAQSLQVPKETKDGHIVMTTGGIKPEIPPASETSATGAIPSAITTITEETTNDKGVVADGPNVAAHTDSKFRFVTPKDFDLLKVIGMGSFGKVLQVRHKHTRRILAMKVISKRLIRRKTGYVENIQAERKILTRVRSPFVVTMHCSFQTKEKLFIIMDFLAGGELFLRLGREGIFLEKTAAFYVAEIIQALESLHSLGILHRDLKPENILLGSDGHVCVTDFGLAKDLSDSGGLDDDENRSWTICGTQEYMAPEMLSRQGYGRAADYWSLGCITYEMLSGLPPFRSKMGAKDLFSKIMSEKVKMPSGCSAAACKLLKGLLCRNVQQRLGNTRSTMFEVGGVAGLKNQEFFKNISWEKLAVKAVDPPHVFAVENENDVQHFHGEFTGMALPRSVLEMSKEHFRPHRVESEFFRGFSFIQEDFDLPERDEKELQSYWDSVEGDGASLSDCASSKADAADFNKEDPDKKKRPPRKRKKKKEDAAADDNSPIPSAINTPSATAANTPMISASNTPAPSENGDAIDDCIVRKPLVQNTDASVVKEIIPTPVAPVKVLDAPVIPQKQKIIATPPKPVVQKSEWQPATRNKGETGGSSQVQNRGVLKAPQSKMAIPQQARGVGTLQVQQRAAAPLTGKPPIQRYGGQASAVTSQPTPWNRPSEQKVGTWGTPPASHPAAKMNVAAPSFTPRAAQPPIPPPPTSDWRNHGMSPQSKRHLIQNQTQPSWPSLATDPPLNPNFKPPATGVNLRGAWASRAKS